MDRGYDSDWDGSKGEADECKGEGGVFDEVAQLA